MLQPSMSSAMLRLLPKVRSSALQPLCLQTLSPLVQADLSSQHNSQDAVLASAGLPSQASRPFSTAVSPQPSHDSTHQLTPAVRSHGSAGTTTAAGATITAGVHQAAAAAAAAAAATTDSQHHTLQQPPVPAFPVSATRLSPTSVHTAASQDMAQHMLQRSGAACASHLHRMPLQTPNLHAGSIQVCSPGTASIGINSCSHSGLATRTPNVAKHWPRSAHSHRCFTTSFSTPPPDTGCQRPWPAYSRRCFTTGISMQAQHRQGAKTGPIAVAISGGVDSAVAAFLLKQAGHDIFGIFMRNWDESEERGNLNCSVEQDLRDAQHICKHLDIPLHEADFIDQYWNRVFSHFVAQYSQGLTPNPDLECNRSIKFDALLEFARGLGAETVATGHYARLLKGEDGGPVQLLKGLDGNKDQSYFLASVPGAALQHFMFPLGSMHKPDVRALAAQAGLISADRRSSAGLCFIGRRNFADFISGYVEPMEARYVGVSTGRHMGDCPNLAAVTWGQRAPIGGLPERCFVVGKDIPNRVVYVTEGGAGPDHPALYTQTALLHNPHWISGRPPLALGRGLPFDCSFKARYRQPDRACQVAAAAANTPEADAAQLGRGFASHFESSRFTNLLKDGDVGADDQLHVRFQEPAKAVTPQQAFVMYEGDTCLGSALVQHPGPSVYELHGSLCEAVQD